MGGSSVSTNCSVVAEIIKAREQIKNSLTAGAPSSAPCVSAPVTSAVTERLQHLEKENADRRKSRTTCVPWFSAWTRVSSRSKVPNRHPVPQLNRLPFKHLNLLPRWRKKTMMMWTSLTMMKTMRKLNVSNRSELRPTQPKNPKKPTLIAKSNIILDIKPWDDETDMKEVENRVREIVADGLLWGAAKLVPLAYGIMKLQITTVVEDDKISVDWLVETIQEIEDLVQSVDIAAFNKI